MAKWTFKIHGNEGADPPTTTWDLDQITVEADSSNDAVKLAQAHADSLNTYNHYDQMCLEYVKSKKKKITIPIQFNGTVDIEVDAELSDKDAHRIAENYALSRCIAVNANEYPDLLSGEVDEDALEDSGIPADKWDEIKMSSIGGMWEPHEADPPPA